MKKVLALLVIGLVCVVSSFADGTNVFNAKEFAISTYGAYVPYNKTDDMNRFGGGVGLSYFVTSWLGGEMTTTKTTDVGSFVENLTIAPVIRLPINKLRVAPYMTAGLGCNFQHDNDRYGFVGAGFEIRLSQHLGLFTDALYMFNDSNDLINSDSWSKDSVTARAGIKFVF